MRWPALFLLPLLLIACEASDREAADARKERRAKRQAEATEWVKKPPEVQKHQVDGHDLLVVTVPVIDGSGLTSKQKCYVWRDTRNKSSSMSCPTPDPYLP